MERRTTIRAAALAVLFAGLAQAHDPGLSKADVTLAPGGATAEIVLARRDVESLVAIDCDGDGSASATEVAAARAGLESLGLGLLELDAERPERVAVSLDPNDAVRFSLRFGFKSPREVRAPLLERLPRGHRQHLEVRNASGALVARGLLGAGRASLDLGTLATAPIGPRPFFGLGLAHILEGWDHLLFLLALLLAGGGVRRAVGVVTAFTAAHSVTLGLAAFGMVHVPAPLVEPLIAASIVWVAAENLLRRESRARWSVAFGFGLVHGLGFASVLADAGIAGHGLGPALGALFAFNAGVEVGQMAVLGVAVAAARALRGIPRLDPALAAATASAAVAACGVYWLVQRTMF